MKKLILQVAAISLLLAGSAFAADMRMPVKAPPAPAPIAVYNWTGCYVGAGGGYGMWNQRVQFITPQGPEGLASDAGGRGWFGTVQVGCDYQIVSNIVIGAFGDFDWTNMKGDVGLPAAGFVAVDEKLKNSWAAGGRIGWIPWSSSQFMWFVSGGFTQARFGETALFRADDGVPRGISIAKHTYDGWFLGTGYEYGLGWFPGLFWKTEYRYADYGKEQVPLFVVASGAPSTPIEVHKRVQTIRSELVWRFNFGGLVVARY
jgi:outer membrane immunogenic protein